MTTNERKVAAGRVAIAVMLVALATGCGKKNHDAIKENAPAFQSMRAELRDLAGRLPPRGSVKLTRAPKLEPALVYDKKGGGNTDILMADQLVDPDTKPELDLSLSTYLLHALNWTGPKNPMSSTTLDERHGDKFDQELKRALARRYLGVVRVVNFAKPVLSGETFTGGELTAEVLLVDLSTKRVVAGGPFSARPSSRVEFRYKKGEDPDEAAKRFIKSTVWVSAREEVRKILEQTTGAAFVFD